MTSATQTAQGFSDTDPRESYRAAQTVLIKAPNDTRAQHQAVLALARLGATDLALVEYARFGLDTISDNEDILAMRGRLFKDAFLNASAASARAFATSAAQAYSMAFARTGGTYSGINAATMHLLANGDRVAAARRAQGVLDRLDHGTANGSEDRYYTMATRAEAFLLLGEYDRARGALRRAVASIPLSYTTHATTLRQFRLIGDALGEAFEWLDQYAPPRPFAYAGHIWDAGRIADPGKLRAKLASLIQKQDLGFGYGALAAGADIIMAEACLENGVELHLFLPQTVDAFLDVSVRPFGPDWEPRFRACLDSAASLNILAGETVPTGRHPSPALCAEVAAGHAILRARHMERDPHFIAVTREVYDDASLTQALHRMWVTSGLSSHVVASGVMDSRAESPSTPPPGIPTKPDLVSSALNFEERLSADDLLQDGSPVLTRLRASGALVDFGRAKPLPFEQAIPGTLSVSADIAAWLMFHNPERQDLVYAGLSASTPDAAHIYTLLNT